MTNLEVNLCKFNPTTCFRRGGSGYCRTLYIILKKPVWRKNRSPRLVVNNQVLFRLNILPFSLNSSCEFSLIRSYNVSRKNNTSNTCTNLSLTPYNGVNLSLIQFTVNSPYLDDKEFKEDNSSCLSLTCVTAPLALTLYSSNLSLVLYTNVTK